MSGLAHFLESEGIATTVVALIELHAELVRPPRALWVPFELGRPLGAPMHRAQHRAVVEAALALLGREDGPVVLDDLPAAATLEEPAGPWTCPIELDDSSLSAEVASILPWYRKAVEKTGRTTVGVSELAPEAIADLLERVDRDSDLKSPTRRLALIQAIRFGIDDLKAMYLEAAAATAGPVLSRQLVEWFWDETLLADRIVEIRAASLASEDATRKMITGWLVPMAELERRGLL